MHGDKLAVEYQVLNNNKHVLLVQEKIGINKNKATFKTLKVIDLKKNESLSFYNGYYCHDTKKSTVYAVVKKSKSKSKPFKLIRGWRVDEEDFKLNAMNDLSKVSCAYETVD